jgi:hypothetical protein
LEFTVLLKNHHLRRPSFIPLLYLREMRHVFSAISLISKTRPPAVNGIEWRVTAPDKLDKLGASWLCLERRLSCVARPAKPAGGRAEFFSAIIEPVAGSVKKFHEKVKAI